MRKINVRSPFYLSGDEDLNPIDLPDPYYYYTATECGGSATIDFRHTSVLTIGQGVKINGQGDTCYEVSATGATLNTTDATFVYDDCDKCNGIPDYLYYAAELCAGGSPINVRSLVARSVGDVISVTNFSSDCYTITGSGTSNTNDIIDTFSNCNHCATGIDYTFYNAVRCGGTEQVTFRVNGSIPVDATVVTLVGYGDKCYTIDSTTTTVSTNEVAAYFNTCTDCIPADPYSYYTATECGGTATVDFRTTQPVTIGTTSVKISGQGTTCYEVTSTASSSNSTDYTDQYTDCTACAAANDPYYGLNFFLMNNCETGAEIATYSPELTWDNLVSKLWYVQGYEGCFTPTSTFNSNPSSALIQGVCAVCPNVTSDPYTYYRAASCSSPSVTVDFRSLVAMTIGKVVKVNGSCWTITAEIQTTNSTDWTELHDTCTECNPPATTTKYDVNLLTGLYGVSLLGKTASELDTDYNCLYCYEDAYTYNSYKALSVPMNVGHQIYDSNGIANTTLTGTFVSNSTSNTVPLDSICYKGAIHFPIIYTFSNGIVTAVNIRTPQDCYQEPTNPYSYGLSCGETYTQSNDVGLTEINVSNAGTGTFQINITNQAVPCKFSLVWNGIEQATTGYIGFNGYDAQLLANGVSAGDINTTAATSVSTTLSFNKTASEPLQTYIRVTSPLISEQYTIKVATCPDYADATLDSLTPITFGGWTPNDIPLGAEIQAMTNSSSVIYQCLDTDYYQPLGGTAAGYVQTTYPNYSLSTWLDHRLLAHFTNWFHPIINNVFISAYSIAHLSTADRESRIKNVRDTLTAHSGGVITYMYLVDNGTTEYDSLYNFVNSLITQDKYWKYIYDQGLLRIVYGVADGFNQAYYSALVANKLNTDFPSDFTLTCV